MQRLCGPLSTLSLRESVSGSSPSLDVVVDKVSDVRGPADQGAVAVVRACVRRSPTAPRLRPVRFDP